MFARPDDLTLLLAQSFHSVTERLQKDSLCREDIRLYTGAPNESIVQNQLNIALLRNSSI